MAKRRIVGNTFSALADPTRRAILARLALGETSVTELAEPFEMSMPAISKHLRVLENAGLVERGRQAQYRPVKLRAEPLREAAGWIEQYRQFWEESFDRFRRLPGSECRRKRPTASGRSRRRKQRRDEMASMARLAGGLGRLLLSVVWFTGPGVIGAGRWTSPVAIETHVDRDGSVFEAKASVEQMETGRRWALRLEFRYPRQRSADESE